MEKNIGLIGVGKMGKMILERLMSAGYSVWASDPAPSAREFIVHHGAEFVESPSKIATHASVIILSLPTPQHIEEVVFGDQGLIESVTAEHIVIDTSTVDPQTTRHAANRLAQTKTRYLDAPILGRPVSIGSWVLPVGGEKEALTQVEPILSIFAKKIVHVGPSGAGNTLKLLNQLMFSTINGITAELFAIA